MSEALLHEPIEIILLLVAIIFVAPLIVKKFNLPGLLGLLISGIFIGPYGLNIVAIDESIELLSEIGLLYIMYLAGLEIDLKQFMKVKEKSLIFGLLAIIFPWTLGFGTALLFDLPIISAILVGIIISSHTLIAYPIISQLGLSDDETVTVTVGGTIITDLLSLVFLAILLGNASGEGGSVLDLLIFFAGFAVYVFVMLYAIPKLVSMFFKRELHEDEEFHITFVVLFLAAVLAELAQLEAIIGAFFAGLAINRLVPKHSRLMQKIEFLGRIFFIPIFMIFIGMQVNIEAFISSLDTVLLALGLIVATFVGKFIASFISSKLFDYTSSGMMTMYSLSIPQVGVTLATIIVGIETGLLTNRVLNAGILLMMITSTIPPILTGKFAKKLGELAVREEKDDDVELTSKILLPINAETSGSNLIDLAGILLQDTGGELFPIHISKPMKSAKPVDIDPDNTPDKILEKSVKYANDLHIPVNPMKRIDEDIVTGIINGIHETDATMVMMEWIPDGDLKAKSFSNIIDHLLEKSSVPVSIARFKHSLNVVPKTVLVLRDYDLRNSYLYDLIFMAKLMSSTLKNDLIIINASHVNILEESTIEEIKPNRPFNYHYVGGSFSKMKKYIGPDDLILATLPPYFTTSSSGWTSTLNTNVEQLTHKMDNSLMLFNFVKKKVALEVSSDE